jgi:hypothetical protein
MTLTPGEIYANQYEDIELAADKERQAVKAAFDRQIAEIDAREAQALAQLRAERRVARAREVVT